MKKEVKKKLGELMLVVWEHHTEKKWPALQSADQSAEIAKQQEKKKKLP